MNRERLLLDAKAQAAALAEAGYAAPQPRTQIPAPGHAALATLETGVFLMGEAGYASEHDQKVARWAAYILAGGRVTPARWSASSTCSTWSARPFSRSAASARRRSASPSPENRQAAAEFHEAQSGLAHRPPWVDHDALADSVVDHRAIYRFYEKNAWTLLEMPQ
jgi:hypothetical protein